MTFSRQKFIKIDRKFDVSGEEKPQHISQNSTFYFSVISFAKQKQQKRKTRLAICQEKSEVMKSEIVNRMSLRVIVNHQNF